MPVICKSYFTCFNRRKIRTGFVGPGYAKSVCSCINKMHALINTSKYLIFILLLYSILSVSEGCSSRSSPKPKPIVVGPTPRPNVTFHTYACPPMHASWYCLNGATCFTVKIGEHTLYNCECAEGYMGPRCEFKDLDSSYLLSRKQVLLETASIAFGATLAILLVVIVCASLYIRYNRKQKQNQKLSVTSYVDSSSNVRRKPFSRRIPATQLPLVKASSASSSSSSQQQQQQQYSTSLPPSFQTSLEKKSDTNYFVFPSVKNVDIESGNTNNKYDEYLNTPHHNHPNYLHYLLLQQVKNQENNCDKYVDEESRQPFERKHADDWCSDTVLPLCLRIMKKIETLFTFELPLRRICEKVVSTLLSEQKTEQLFRHTDIVEFCKPVTVVSDSNHRTIVECKPSSYKVLTVVPAVCIPVETKILIVDVKLEKITPELQTIFNH